MISGISHSVNQSQQHKSQARITGSIVDGYRLVLICNHQLDKNALPQASDFTVTTKDTSVMVVSVNVNTPMAGSLSWSSIELVLDQPVSSSQAVSVQYYPINLRMKSVIDGLGLEDFRIQTQLHWQHGQQAEPKVVPTAIATSEPIAAPQEKDIEKVDSSTAMQVGDAESDKTVKSVASEIPVDEEIALERKQRVSQLLDAVEQSDLHILNREEVEETLGVQKPKKHVEKSESTQDKNSVVENKVVSISSESQQQEADATENKTSAKDAAKSALNNLKSSLQGVASRFVKFKEAKAEEKAAKAGSPLMIVSVEDAVEEADASGSSAKSVQQLTQPYNKRSGKERQPVGTPIPVASSDYDAPLYKREIMNSVLNDVGSAAAIVVMVTLMFQFVV